jgi:DegT/DnrJ/EryC1/StrS aminotransferase family protein
LSDIELIPIAAPHLDGREASYVQECLETTWISSAGRFIDEFEISFAEFCDAEYAIATNNGTTALHLALVALGIGPGDEVIVPTLTYVATANAVTYCGATPVLTDSEPVGMTMDVADVRRKITSRTKAIVPVHLYGHAADMDSINALAREHDLLVVEDAAEAHGARAGGRMVGSIGTCASFSFFGNKIVTTGEGGAVTTNDADLAARLRLLRGQGMDLGRRYWFPVVGYNYRPQSGWRSWKVSNASWRNVRPWPLPTTPDWPTSPRFVRQMRRPGAIQSPGCTPCCWTCRPQLHVTRSVGGWRRMASRPGRSSTRCIRCPRTSSPAGSTRSPIHWPAVACPCLPTSS